MKRAARTPPKRHSYAFELTAMVLEGVDPQWRRVQMALVKASSGKVKASVALLPAPPQGVPPRLWVHTRLLTAALSTVPTLHERKVRRSSCKLHVGPVFGLQQLLSCCCRFVAVLLH
jgi:hypothetical protein